MQIEQVEGGRRACERDQGKGACVCHRENKGQRSAGVFAYVVDRRRVGERNDMGKNPYWKEKFGNAAKITQRRTPLLRSKPLWIVRLAHVDVDSAVWERRHRKQDRSASAPKREYCGQRTRWKKNPTSVSV